METAKYNLVNNYLVVGLTEELGDFVAVLEAALPRFFAGATQLYNTGELLEDHSEVYKIAFKNKIQES